MLWGDTVLWCARSCTGRWAQCLHWKKTLPDMDLCTSRTCSCMIICTRVIRPPSLRAGSCSVLSTKDSSTGSFLKGEDVGTSMWCTISLRIKCSWQRRCTNSCHLCLLCHNTLGGTTQGVTVQIQWWRIMSWRLVLFSLALLHCMSSTTTNHIILVRIRRYCSYSGRAYKLLPEKERKSPLRFPLWLPHKTFLRTHS